MSLLRYGPLVLKQVLRQRGRTLLTAAGIAIAMFLFTLVQALQAGVRTATEQTAGDTTLVVYRQSRFCPATSELPEDYGPRIAKLPGVAAVTPMKIVVTNCRTSLDVVTFRGVPKEAFLAQRGPALQLLEGSLDDWRRRTDAALVGQTLAKRRGLRPGMTFDAAGITVYVAGVFTSDDPQDQNVAYTALPFVQLAGRDRLGVVTQFNIQVTEPAQLGPVAQAIDQLFANAQDPTSTFTEKAFVARIADDVVELVGFARWLGVGCLAAVLALVGNSIMLGVQSRVMEHAVLQTLGYSSRLVAGLIVAEGALLALLGGFLGASLALAAAHWSNVALSVEGLSIPVHAEPALLATGLLVCGGLGVLAGLAPAWQAARRPIAACFRAV